MNTPWYKNVYRRQLTDMHISDARDEYLSAFDPEEYYSDLKTAHIESPMIYLQAHTGLCYYPTKVARTHRAMQGKNNGIRRLISLCKNDGMKVVGYYSLIFNNVAAELHPDWQMRYPDGTTWQDHGQRYGLCCPNNEDYRAFLKENLAELAAYFDGLDGIFYDMPYWEVLCRCDACKKRFRRETGKDLPTVDDLASKDYKLFLKKRQEWMAEFVAFTKKTSLALMPHTTVEFNFAAVIGCDYVGGSTEAINEHCEFTGGDLYGDLYSHSFTAKYYYRITKHQPFEYMSCRCDKSLREHTITKPQKMLNAEILLTCAHHGATLNIDAVNPDGTLDRRVYEKVGAAFDLQIPYEKYMDRGTLYAEAAVYFDSTTQFPDEFAGTYNKLCAVSAHKTLVERHIPTAVVANGSMQDLDRFSLIVAPDLQDFENEEPERLVDYVKNGGTLYLSGRSRSSLTKEFFGAEYLGKTYGESTHRHTDKGYPEVQCYAAPTDAGEKYFGEFTKKYPLPLTYRLPLVSIGRGKVLATVTLPYTDPDDNAIFASIHSNPPGAATEYPAVVETTYGKGRVIWSLPVIEKDERQSFKDLFASLIADVAPNKYEIEASRFVEAVTFEEEHSALMSFVDLDPAFEQTPRSVALTLPESTTAVSLTSGVDVTVKDRRASFTFTRFCMIELRGK